MSIKKLRSRWHAPTPATYKRLQRWLAAVSALCLALTANPNIPTSVGVVGSIATGLGAFLTQFTAEEPKG